MDVIVVLGGSARAALTWLAREARPGDSLLHSQAMLRSPSRNTEWRYVSDMHGLQGLRITDYVVIVGAEVDPDFHHLLVTARRMKALHGPKQ